LELGALDFAFLPGLLGVFGFFAMAGIWDESGRLERGSAATRYPCQQMSADAELRDIRSTEAESCNSLG
jgi:hypothetical protein